MFKNTKLITKTRNNQNHNILIHIRDAKCTYAIDIADFMKTLKVKV